jgi:thiamine-phosphate pyrophosphorylase
LIRCYITGRTLLPPGVSLLDSIARNLAAGVDIVQIREKDLSARALYDLTRAALLLPNPRRARILVNSRADVALAAGAHGVHLPAGSPPPSVLRALSSAPFTVGVSCHSIEEVARAAREAADFALFGPVFATPSKLAYGPPQGLDKLRQAAGASIPVLALGGVSEQNLQSCLDAGAAGIAAIRLFQSLS